MTKEIYISSTPHETRLAVVEDDQLAEIYYERENEYTLAGSVYKGKVTRVLPGMQSAFVDIGLERDAFLYVTDFAEEQEDGEEYISLPQGQSNGVSRDSSSGVNRPSANSSQRPAPQSKAETPQESSPNAGSGDNAEPGGRRWRGRRGRRRGRGNAPQQSPSAVTPLEIESAEPAIISGLNQVGSFEPEAAPPDAAAPRTEVTVLPGESLSKYRRGQEPAPSIPISVRGTSASQTPASSYQPSTLVTAPLAWDGSDVLPGESLSRHKKKSPPQSSSSLAAETSAANEVAEKPAHPEFEPLDKISAEPDPSDALHEHPLHEHPIALHPLAPRREVDGPEVSEAPSAAIGEESEPTSASYRFDPAAPSAYRQSGVAEPETSVLESQPDAQEEPFFPPPQPEPFFGESVPIAEPAHHSGQAQEASSLAGEVSGDTTFDERVPSGPEAGEANEDVSDESEAANHAFDPGLGELEEETIDEEEPETYLAQSLAEDDDYDDLVEETLDVQDSGLLSELVRDQHIDERTGYSEDHGAKPEPEDDSFGEEQSVFDEESAGIELEEIGEIDEEAGGEEETEDRTADSSRERSDTRRSHRRGVRGQRPGQSGNRGRMRRSTAQITNLPAITELLKPNQEILVQIAKEPIARKGARITSHIALPGRFLVFMPTVNHVGVSRKISSEEERQRLKQILLSEKGAASGGFIVRTAAASASEEDLRADIRFLLTLWADIKQRADNSKPPALIYHDLSLVERVLRDQVTDNFSAIWVDSEQDYERVLRFLNRFEPSLVRRVKLYTKETPLFEQFGIQEEINKALRSKVWLKSGGSIVINQTEALVAIDINTGKYVGKTARLEDTILKTNLDAIPEIVRQIRLRDLGGIIVIDFIDMDERKNRNKVMQVLEDALKSDRAPSKVLQFNDFGLVAITRKRVKQSLERTLSVPCYICTGTGMVKGPLTVCNEIYVELRKMHRQIDRGDVLLRVHPEVVKQLKATNGRWLSEMEEMSGKTIIVKSDPALHPEQFDIH